MKTIVLDLSNCKYLGEIHEAIRQSFAFPNFYGENWDAFEDLLWSNCDAEKIEIHGEGTLSKALFNEMQIMHQILDYEKKRRLSEGVVFEYAVMD